MTAVERVNEYGAVAPEGPEDHMAADPGPDWPDKGCITFDNLVGRVVAPNGLRWLLIPGAVCSLPPGIASRSERHIRDNQRHRESWNLRANW